VDTVDYYIFLLIIMSEVFVVSMVAYLYKETNKTFINEKKKIIWKKLSLSIIVTSLIGIVCTNYLTIQLNYGTSLDLRDFPVMFAGMVAGPLVGIPAGLIVGLDKFLMGGDTAIPCALATILSGVLGSVLWYLSGRKFPTIFNATILMLATGILQICLISLMVDDSYNIATTIAPFLIIGNTVCMVITSYIYHKYVINEDKKVI
jgi:LytS/YehU family sensor histidine kinase